MLLAEHIIAEHLLHIAKEENVQLDDMAVRIYDASVRGIGHIVSPDLISQFDFSLMQNPSAETTSPAVRKDIIAADGSAPKAAKARRALRSVRCACQ